MLSAAAGGIWKVRAKMVKIFWNKRQKDFAPILLDSSYKCFSSVSVKTTVL